MQFITSKNNSRLKELKKVQQNKSFRQENNLTIIEGLHLVETYIDEKNDFLALFCSESFNKNYPEYSKEEWEDKIYILPDNFFNDISELKTPTGILSLIEIPQNDSYPNHFNDGLYLFLDKVQDPGNLGTILRTSQALGHKGIFLSEQCADPWSPKTLRASQGFQFQLPIYQNVDISNLISHGFSFVAADLNGRSVFDYNFAHKTILILGSEGQGITTNLKNITYDEISLPMLNNVESLNVAVSAAIIGYQFSNQFKR